MEKFKDRVVIVTGGASGIGRALCEELASRGAFVVLADINLQKAQDVTSRINKSVERVRPAYLDVSKDGQVQNLIEETAQNYGRLEYLFNNAGVAITGEVRDITLDQWANVLGVNLNGVLFGTTAAYQIMAQQGFGHIVNTASLGGLVGFPTNVPYATSKYAVVGMSTSLREEGEALGVKVSVVCPGYVTSNIFQAATILKADREKVLSGIPFELMDTTKAAAAILRGVERNQAIIVFPLYARVLWWFSRINPALVKPLAQKTIRDFRAVRRV